LPAQKEESSMPSNAAALTRLMFAEDRVLKRFFARMVDRDNLEDTFQALWLRVQRVADEPAIEDRNAFLFYLARNVALDQGRAEARRKRLQAEIESIVWGGGHVVPVDEVLIAQDDLNRVMARAAALPEPCRTIFYLNRMDNIPQRDIAKRLGVSRTTVEKHMRRALAALGEALAAG
jgi:RNA polymerase sigma factor (sigma-70 family)